MNICSIKTRSIKVNTKLPRQLKRPRQLLPAPNQFWFAPNENFKIRFCPFHIFAYEFQYLEVIFIHSRFRNLEGHFHISFKLLDGHIWKWIMNSEILYPEWCVVNGVEDWDPELIYVCLRILTFKRSFMLSK